MLETCMSPLEKTETAKDLSGKKKEKRKGQRGQDLCSFL